MQLKKISKWSDYNQMERDKMRSSEKDWTLPKLFPLTSWNQATKINKKTGVVTEEMKWSKMTKENSENKWKQGKWMRLYKMHGNGPNLI